MDIDFAAATVVYNNLGGSNTNADPSDPDEIYYQGIAALNGQRVNLRITTSSSTYFCDPVCGNVIDGDLGQIPLGGYRNHHEPRDIIQ